MVPYSTMNTRDTYSKAVVKSWTVIKKKKKCSIDFCINSYKERFFFLRIFKESERLTMLSL